MELVHQDPRDLEYHEETHQNVVHDHVEYETHAVEYETQPAVVDGRQHDVQHVPAEQQHVQHDQQHDQGHYEQKYQAQDEYEEKYDAKYNQQTELVDTYPR